ncbi:MAG: low molecular weight protein-tyrosine-phosphatase [Ruminococcus sp.]
MTKIMFVCHGNICRSPMAEFVMKKLVRDANLENEFYIASSATSTEEIWRGVGNPIYPPARREMTKQGIPFDVSKRAVQLKADDYEKYDYIIAMDSMNVRNIIRIIGSDKMGKVHKLMDYTSKKGDVADPWYSGNFEVALSDIYNGCVGLLNHIQSI